MDKYQESKNRYLKENVDRFSLSFPKGMKEQVREYSKTKARSLNAYIIDLINKDMARNSDE